MNNPSELLTVGERPDFDKDQVFHCMQGYSDFPLQSVWLKTQMLFRHSQEGIVAYQKMNRVLIVAGDPLIFSGCSRQQVMESFIYWAHERGYSVCGYYFSEELAQSLKCSEFYHAGVSRILNLDHFSLRGHVSRDLRRALNHGNRLMMLVEEIHQENKKNIFAAIKEMEESWIQTKRGPRIGFLLSSIQENFLGSQHERWFVVRRCNGEIEAFVSLLPYKNNGNYYVDQFIQSVDGHKFALDFLLLKVISVLKQEGCRELSLGFNAFQKISPSNLLETVIWLNGFLQLFYKSKGLYQYKKKFTTNEHKRYFMLDPYFPKWEQLIRMAQVTYQRV